MIVRRYVKERAGQETSYGRCSIREPVLIVDVTNAEGVLACQVKVITSDELIFNLFIAGDACHLSGVDRNDWTRATAPDKGDLCESSGITRISQGIRNTIAIRV